VAAGDAGLGRCVEEGRLPGVGVPRQRHGGCLGPPPFLAPDVALAAQLAEPLAEQRDAAARQATVRLELGLAGAAGADAGAEPAGAAAGPLEVRPHPPPPPQVLPHLPLLSLYPSPPS